MDDVVQKAFRILDSTCTFVSICDTCCQLFQHSDQYICAQPPFSTTDVRTIGRAIAEYIVMPDLSQMREVAFEGARTLVGHEIDIDEYASMFSSDMLFQNLSVKFHLLDHSDLISKLKIFLAAILFRYSFCVRENRAAFPVSVLIEYFNAGERLLKQESRQDRYNEFVAVTLEAMRECEPRM